MPVPIARLVMRAVPPPGALPPARPSRGPVRRRVRGERSAPASPGGSDPGAVELVAVEPGPARPAQSTPAPTGTEAQPGGRIASLGPGVLVVAVAAMVVAAAATAADLGRVESVAGIVALAALAVGGVLVLVAERSPDPAVADLLRTVGGDGGRPAGAGPPQTDLPHAGLPHTDLPHAERHVTEPHPAERLPSPTVRGGGLSAALRDRPAQR